MNPHLDALEAIHRLGALGGNLWNFIKGLLAKVPWSVVEQILIALLPLIIGGKIDPTMLTWVENAVALLVSGKVTEAWIIAALQAFATGQPLPPLPVTP